jgi:hypothetical protein
MASITWNGQSGDWTNAADWSGGKLPGASNPASYNSALGSFTV